eukprot:3771865-Amphidinium_carterae.2
MESKLEKPAGQLVYKLASRQANKTKQVHATLEKFGQWVLTSGTATLEECLLRPTAFIQS